MNKKTSTTIHLLAPFTGVCCPLSQVPDAAFSQKMVGDGLAIDPTENILHAPCDATVTQIHPSKHAVTLLTATGIEILLHIGVDTVKLKGEGFKELVKVGDAVKAKTPLIELDLDKVGCGVKSLRTVILLTDMTRIITLTPTTEQFVNAGDLLFSAEVSAAARAVTKSDDMVSSAPIVVINPTGIHARPAAAIVTAIKAFDCDVMIDKAGKQANARSVVGLMGLDIAFGEQIVILAKGKDQQAAIAALSEAISTGLGEEGADASLVTKNVKSDFDPFSEPSLLLQTSQDPRQLIGVEASPGQVKGRLYVIKAEVPKFDTFADDAQVEQQTLDDAMKVANQTLVELVEELHNKDMGQKADIFVAHQELMSDPDLYDDCIIELQQGKSAPYAWSKSICRQADKLAGMENPLLAGRATDLIDVGNRVSRIMQDCLKILFRLNSPKILF
ncbi:glucose PTS transporter subunit IIA [Shewanella psychromarinicola]|uniref:glucose PTS transporter subunit IIA n=1 Tax=Shewanella psychromarinicola TaxID=2487742 RepID=UPI0020102704|nr:glucose PTS transporter subunit IIA [Shewanella psychromarinicola]MCL1084234.1 glucose PTS transporter subunit IIA [Shewanella psychromarinicola]